MWSAGSSIDFAGARGLLNLTEAARNAVLGKGSEAAANVGRAVTELQAAIPLAQGIKDVRIGKQMRGFLRAGDSGKEKFLNS
jgi:hypothetical protein